MCLILELISFAPRLSTPDFYSQVLLTRFVYFFSGYYDIQSKYDDSPVHWVQPTVLSKPARIFVESRSRPIFLDQFRDEGDDYRGNENNKGGQKGQKGKEKLPGGGYKLPPGLFDGKRLCANAYFTKNMIFAMIQTLEYQKQMAMMLQTMVEGGQLSGGGTGGGGTSSGSTTEAVSSTEATTQSTTLSTTESTTASTTESTTASTTESTTTTTTTAPTSPSTGSGSTEASTITPQTVQDLLNLLTDILTILPDLLAQFAALEQNAMENGNAAAADEIITSDLHMYEVTDEKQEAIDRLSILESTLKDTDLPHYTKQLAQSRDLVVKIIEQTMQDITVLAPTDMRVKYLVKEFNHVARSQRFKEG